MCAQRTGSKSKIVFMGASFYSFFFKNSGGHGSLVQTGLVHEVIPTLISLTDTSPVCEDCAVVQTLTNNLYPDPWFICILKLIDSNILSHSGHSEETQRSDPCERRYKRSSISAGQITHMTAGIQFLFTNSRMLDLAHRDNQMDIPSASPFSSVPAAIICVNVLWILT